ncbi:MAG: hypothetical protein WDA12_04925 [Bacilli bacterium]
MNAKNAKKILRERGMVIKRDEYGEYQVNFSEGKEATAYYTDDLEDAVNTGLSMADWRDSRGPEEEG